MDRTVYEDLLHRIAEGLNHADIPRDNHDFNIFSILRIETKEVFICRLLSELLNPFGSHQLGATPLLLFIKSVLQLHDVCDTEAEKVRVVTEEQIDEKRRVDIVIHAGKKVIPIEVKVWAGDQEAQLYDYYNYYRNSGARCIYYLTPTGWPPSAKSRGALQVGKEVQLLSFDKNIKPWLKSLLPACKTEAVKIFIKQFEEVIDRMCKANTELTVIEDVLCLNHKTFDPAKPSLQAFAAIVNCKEALTQKIQQRYLQQYIEPVPGYDLITEIDNEDKKIDSHVVARIQHNGKTVAWLCVATNLYLVARKVKTSKDLWKEGRPKEYYWSYITPKDYLKDTLALGNLKEMPKEQIAVSHLLSDIDLSES